MFMFLVQDTSFQLQRLVKALSQYHTDCHVILEPTRNLFPIEVDLSQVSVKYNTTGQLPPEEDYSSTNDKDVINRNLEKGQSALDFDFNNDDVPIIDLQNDQKSDLQSLTSQVEDLLKDF